MATPRKKPTKPETDIIIDENTTVDVKEIHGANGITKTLSYKAKALGNSEPETETETETENEHFDAGEHYAALELQEIPKDKIDKIFDDLEFLEAKETDYFYAKLTRIPDAMTDAFFVVCSSEMPSGVFQFSLRDRFSFIDAIQKRNGNSGGRFNIAVFDSNQKPVQVFAGYDNPYSNRRQAIYKPVGAINAVIPNPFKDETQNNGQNNNFSMVEVLAQMQAASDRRLETILAAMREKSPFEKAFEQKMMNDMLNPPAPVNNTNAFEQTMLTMLSMPVMVEKFSKRMFPEPAPVALPPEPTTFDRVLQVVNLPQVQGIIEKVGDIAEAVAVSKLQQQNPALAQAANETENETENEQPEQLPQNTVTTVNENMKNLINELIIELESDSEINAENTTLIKLQTDYKEQFDTVKAICKMASFEQVLTQLVTLSNNIQPYPFEPFIIQVNGQPSWNERGQKVVSRLQLVYEYLQIT